MPEVIRLFKRSLDSLDELHTLMVGFSASCSLPQLQANELAVSIEELFVNAVRHSSGQRGDIELQLSFEGDILTIRLVDMGVDQLDITQLAPANLDLPIEQRRTGGMGLHIVRHFADRFYYTYENGNGIITIEKNIRVPDVTDTE